MFISIMTQRRDFYVDVYDKPKTLKEVLLQPRTEANYGLWQSRQTDTLLHEEQIEPQNTGNFETLSTLLLLTSQFHLQL